MTGIRIHKDPDPDTDPHHAGLPDSLSGAKAGDIKIHNKSQKACSMHFKYSNLRLYRARPTTGVDRVYLFTQEEITPKYWFKT